MTKYMTYAEEEVEIPDNIDQFVREYEGLCIKHNIMIVSDGEPVTVMEYKKDLWGLREAIAGELLDDKDKEKQ